MQIADKLINYPLSICIIGVEPVVRVGSVEIGTPAIFAAAMTAKGGESAGNDSFSSIVRRRYNYLSS